MAVFVMVVFLCACGSRVERNVVQVRGSSTIGASAAPCFLFIRQRIIGGGSESYCLKTYTGKPGPNATLRDAGVMTFALPGQVIRARVQIVARFARDGHHAVQRLNGTVIGGGTISGGGPYVENPPGHVASSNLRYVITVR